MDFIVPSPTLFTVYTKRDCRYCHLLKVLLQDTFSYSETPCVLYVECDDYLASDRSGFLSFIQAMSNKEHRTFPMVFYKGDFVGGYMETKDFVRDNLFSFDQDFD